MTANTYVINSITDLYKIPLDRLPDCMSELAQAITEFRRMNTETGVPLPDTLQWVDDGKRYVTLSVDGQPQVSVPLTSHDSDNDIALWDEAVDLAEENGELGALLVAFPGATFDRNALTAWINSPDRELQGVASDTKTRHSDPAFDYTDRSGRWLNRHERMAERDFARNCEQDDTNL